MTKRTKSASSRALPITGLLTGMKRTIKMFEFVIRQGYPSLARQNLWRVLKATHMPYASELAMRSLLSNLRIKESRVSAYSVASWSRMRKLSIVWMTQSASGLHRFCPKVPMSWSISMLNSLSVKNPQSTSSYSTRLRCETSKSRLVRKIAWAKEKLPWQNPLESPLKTWRLIRMHCKKGGLIRSNCSSSLSKKFCTKRCESTRTTATSSSNFLSVTWKDPSFSQMSCLLMTRRRPKSRKSQIHCVKRCSNSWTKVCRQLKSSTICCLLLTWLATTPTSAASSKASSSWQATRPKWIAHTEKLSDKPRRRRSVVIRRR